jgi:penicillin-binding protein 1B
MNRTRRSSSYRYQQRRSKTKTRSTHRITSLISRVFSSLRLRWRLLFFFTLLSSLPLIVYAISMDGKVREHFEGKRWALPAHVYAQPLELYTGMILSPQDFINELDAVGYQKTEQIQNPEEFSQKGQTVSLMTRAFKFWDTDEPSRSLQVQFENNRVKSIKNLNAQDQSPLVRIKPRLIGKIYPTHNEDRTLVQLSEVPPLLIKALLAVEDRSFYTHYGISLRGLLRAILKNTEERELVQGGSTITQQLVKNFYLSPERTFKRKFNEAIMSVLLEWHYTKEQILEAYLNEVYLGQDGNHSVHGMGLASRFYFGRSITNLKLPEVALLASLVKGASIYNPRKHADRALRRRNMVLDLMVEQNMISEGESEIAKIEPLGIIEKSESSESSYPAFLELVQNQLRADYREEDLRSEGLQIFTTLAPFIQTQAEKAMIEGIKQLERENRSTRKLEGAVVVTSTENGEILAFVNGRDPNFAGFNRPLNAVRPIGSLVKSAIYLAALEDSRRYSLTTLLSDAPYEWKDKKSGTIWKPQNYDSRFHGQVRLYTALANSYNLATVRLGMNLGLEKIKETLERLGVERDFQMYPAALLGSISLTPLEVAQMYQTIASGGFRVPLRAIRNVLTHEGKPLQRYELSVEQHFDPAPIFVLNYALEKAVRNGTGKVIAKTLPEDMVVAGKTGTSNDLRDSWFVGFGSDLLTITWLGRDDNKPIYLSGGQGAMRVWGDFVKKVKPQSLAPTVPNRIFWQWIDYASGKISSKGRSGAVLMPFISKENGEEMIADNNEQKHLYK